MIVICRGCYRAKILYNSGLRLFFSALYKAKKKLKVVFSFLLCWVFLFSDSFIIFVVSWSCNDPFTLASESSYIWFLISVGYFIIYKAKSKNLAGYFGNTNEDGIFFLLGRGDCILFFIISCFGTRICIGTEICNHV